MQKVSGSTVLNQSRTHNKVNEVTDISETVGPAWATPAHDRAGNMTTVPDPLGLTAGLTLKYDAWNRLVEVKDGNEVIAQYEYDGLNRRVLKRVPVTGQGSASGGGPEYETDYYFHNQGWQVLETRRTDQSSASPDNLQPRYQYVWSARYIDAPILRDKNTDQDWLCDDERLYYLTDANFSVTSLIDTNGDAVERYLYDPYGKVTIYDGTWTATRSSSLYNNVYLYTGREYDPETGLYHSRRRPLHVELGRFPSRDPIGHQTDGLNVYQYVRGRPTIGTDPRGLQYHGIPWVEGPYYRIEASVGAGNSIHLENEWGHPNVPFCTGASGKVTASRQQRNLTTQVEIWGAAVNVWGVRSGTCNSVTRWLSPNNKSPNAGSINLYLRNLPPGKYNVTYAYSASATTNLAGRGGGPLLSVNTLGSRAKVEGAVGAGGGAISGKATTTITVTSDKGLTTVAELDINLTHTSSGNMWGDRWKSTSAKGKLTLVIIEDLPPPSDSPPPSE